MPDNNYASEFESVIRDVTQEDIAYRNDLRNSGQSSVDVYERDPVFDNEYTGPRFKYGLTNAPYRVSTVPKGEIQKTYKPEDKECGSQYGTIEYPYALTEEQIHNFKLIDIQAIKKLANVDDTISLSRAEYEVKPPYSDEYNGPRYKYGFRNRPYGIATCPKGSILMTYNENDKTHGSRHGTIEYPFPLTKDDVYSFELVDFQQILEDQKRFINIRTAYETALKSRGFNIKTSTEDNMLATIDVAGPEPRTLQTKIYQDRNSYHIALNNDSRKAWVYLDAANPEELLSSVTRALQWFDKDLAKVQDYITTRQPAEYPAIRTEKLNTWSKPSDGTITIHTGGVPSQGEVVAIVFSNCEEAKRMAAANDTFVALQDCMSLLQSPGMKELLEKQRMIDTKEPTTGKLCKSYLEQSVELRIEQGTKALGIIQSPEKERTKPKSCGMGR